MSEFKITELDDLREFIKETNPPVDAKWACDILGAAAARIEELEAVISRLPKTADGVPVVPGTKTKLWNPDYFGTKFFCVDASWIEHTPDCLCQWSVAWGGPEYDASDVGKWYSTREAAEQARATNE